MIKIYFGVTIDPNKKKIIAAEEIINNFQKYEELFNDNYLDGSLGRLTIKYYNHKLSIQDEFLSRLILVIHLNAVEKLIKNETFRYDLEERYTDHMTFDFIDGKDTGVRIRHYGIKRYYDSNGECVYASRNDYLIQELILPKYEYMEKMIYCAEQYIIYRESFKVKSNFDSHLDIWKQKLTEIKKLYCEAIRN